MAKSPAVPEPTSDLAVWVKGFENHPQLHRTVLEMLAHDENPAATIAMGLLTGTSIEDVFGQRTATKWNAGETYTVTDVTLQRSDYDVNEDSLLPVYAVISTDSGETLIHGGTNVVSSLIAAKANGWLPLALTMVAVTTGRNFTVYRLVLPKAAPDTSDEKPF